MKDEKKNEDPRDLLREPAGYEEMPGVSPDPPEEEGETDTAGEKRETDTEKRKAYRKAWRRIFSDTALLLALLLILAVALSLGQKETGPDEVKTETEIMETEKETERETEEETETELLIRYEKESEDWKETVFGLKGSSVLSNISVTGMNAREKEETGFRETDFLTALSSFLKDRNLTGVTSVNFTDKISCSAPGAHAYRAGLSGAEDEELTVIFYEDYPECYLFTLAEKEEEPEDNLTPAEPAETALAEEPGGEGDSQLQSETLTRTYDASTLSISGIPATLSNYLVNRYELQYTLYDFLYRNGRAADEARVSDYEIDAEKREAAIMLTLSDGSTVACTYSRDANSYSYR